MIVQNLRFYLALNYSSTVLFKYLIPSAPFNVVTRRAGWEFARILDEINRSPTGLDIRKYLFVAGEIYADEIGKILGTQRLVEGIQNCISLVPVV